MSLLRYQDIKVIQQMCYNIEDLLTVCPGLDIPIVVDYHHDWINVRHPYASHFSTNISSALALFTAHRGAHTYSERDLDTQRHSCKTTPLRTTPRSSNDNGTPRACRPVQVLSRLPAGRRRLDDRSKGQGAGRI